MTRLWTVTLLVCLTLTSTMVKADRLKDFGRMSNDTTRTDRINILDKDGDIIYYIEGDRILPGRRLIIYDDDGEEVGVWEEDLIRPGDLLLRFRRFND